MPKEVKILKGQTLADIAIQECGQLEGLRYIAKYNSCSMTEDLGAGFLLDIYEEGINANTLRIITKEGIKPACKFSPFIENEALPPVLGGIGYMAVGIDFIVS